MKLFDLTQGAPVYQAAVIAFPLALAAVYRERAAPGSEPLFDPDFDSQLQERRRLEENRADMTKALWRIRARAEGAR